MQWLVQGPCWSPGMLPHLSGTNSHGNERWLLVMDLGVFIFIFLVLDLIMDFYFNILGLL